MAFEQQPQLRDLPEILGGDRRDAEAALMLITYVPELVLWLPRQMGYQG